MSTPWFSLKALLLYLLDWTGDSFDRYRAASKLTKVSALIYSIGAEFNKHFTPRHNMSFEQVKFNTTVHNPGGSVEAFVRHLYELNENRHFGAQIAEQMRDWLVVEIHDNVALIM